MLPKKPPSMVIFLLKVGKSYQDLSSQADPATIEPEVIEPEPEVIQNYFNLNRPFVLVENTITHALSILTRFEIKFLKNAWGFNRGVTQRNELQSDVFNTIQKDTML